MKPKIIAIAGTSSNSGKTTLLCDLLRELSKTEAWEAIKLTKGHYRSCGKDPRACCVSHLLSDQPTVRSGREATYTFGKDTGRYWEAGAANVHWVIATDSQVEAGINEAILRVAAPNVLIEGTSLLQVVPVDFAVLVVGGDMAKPKTSARHALAGRKINALYLSDKSAACRTVPDMMLQTNHEIDTAWLKKLPLITMEEIPQLLELILASRS